MIPKLQKYFPNFHLSVALFRRDLQAEFRESFFGFIWLLVPTLAITGSFLLANQASFLSTDNTAIPYPAYLICSLVLWQLFADSMSAPVAAIDKTKKIATRVAVSPGVFILSKLLEVYTHFGIKLLMIAGALILFKVNVNLATPLFILCSLVLSALGVLIGVVLAPFAILYRDVVQSLPFVLNVWMFLTPVVYPVSDNSAMRILSLVNPVTPILATTRDFLTGSNSFLFLDRFLYMTPVVLVSLFLAFRFLKFSWPTVVDRIGN